MKYLHENKHIVVGLVALGVLVLFFVLAPLVLRNHYVFDSQKLASNSLAAHEPLKTPEGDIFVPSYIDTPEPLKGIYMTSWIASSASLRQKLVDIIDQTEINALVIDIKDYSGKIVFTVTNPTLKAYGSEEVRIRDLPEFIETLHKKHIYVIGRIAVFQDAYFVKHNPDIAVKNKAGTAVWKDHKGISWVDAGSREYWDYIILLARESRTIGFDEINFDYIRFPSDGNMQDISFPHSTSTPKAQVIKNFFAYARAQLLENDGTVTDATQTGAKTRLKMSADLFGMVTTARDDMGIGQLLENALPYFDYIAPMVYPSHYPASFQNFAQPEAHPYDVVHFAMQSAVTRRNALASSTKAIGNIQTPGTTGTLAEFRPWLQDFGLKMTYGPAEVRAQIKATNDVGISSWMLWSASNKYTRGALDTE